MAVEKDYIVITIKEEVDGHLVDKEYPFTLYYSDKYVTSDEVNNYVMIIDKKLTPQEIAEGEEEITVTETNIPLEDTSTIEYIKHLYTDKRYKTVLVIGVQGEKIFITNRGKKQLLDLSNINMMEFFYKDKDTIWADVVNTLKEYITDNIKPSIVEDSVSASLESVSNSVTDEVTRQTSDFSDRITSVGNELSSFKTTTGNNFTSVNTTINDNKTAETNHYNSLVGTCNTLSTQISNVGVDNLKPIGAPIPRLIDLTVEGQEYVLRPNEIVLNGTLLNKDNFLELFDVYKYTYNKDTDTDLNYFRLPDLTGRVLWGNDTLSNPYIDAGLPNITGKFSIGGDYYIRVLGLGGAFSGATKKGNTDKGGSDPGTGFRVCQFNANDGATDWNVSSAGIYGGSTTVQPPAIKVLWVTRYR